MKRSVILTAALVGLMVLGSSAARADHWRTGGRSNFGISISYGRGFSGYNAAYGYGRGYGYPIHAVGYRPYRPYRFYSAPVYSVPVYSVPVHRGYRYPAGRVRW